MADDNTPAPEAGDERTAEEKAAELEARLRGEDVKKDDKDEGHPDSRWDDPPDEDPEDLDEIVAKADKPDAVRNALLRHKKAADEARARLKEYEDAEKTDRQKLEDRLVEAEERVAKAEREANQARFESMRLEVATAKRLPPKLAERLQGKNRRELETDAERLLEWMKPGAPSGDVDAGKGVEDKTDEDDFNNVLRRKAGLKIQ